MALPFTFFASNTSVKVWLKAWGFWPDCPCLPTVVKLSNGETKKFPALPCGHSDFNRLQWFGFMSMANAKAVYYLDNVKIAPVK